MYLLANNDNGDFMDIVSNKLTGEIRELLKFKFNVLEKEYIDTFFIFKITGAIDNFFSPHSGFLGVAPVDKFDQDQRNWNIAQ